MKTHPEYPRRQHDTYNLLVTLLLSLIILVVVILATSCALPDTEGANPLDRPVDLKSARTLHEENIAAITSNPAYRLP